MPKKYTGPERREQHWLGGAPARDTRRGPERQGVGKGRRGHMMSGEITATTRSEVLDEARAGRGIRNTQPVARGVHGIVEIKEEYSKPERRIGGAGRRKGDLLRALDSGEGVIFDVSKTPMRAFKGLGKLAKKVISKKLKLGP